MHTENTLGWLDQSTKELGTQIRKFSKHTCPCFNTVELPVEEAARVRRQARKSNKTAHPTPASASKKKLPFNLIMYKLHALGDYTRTIRAFGTTDSYSTQPVRSSFLVNDIQLTDWMFSYRGNWNIDESSGFMRVQIKTQRCIR